MLSRVDKVAADQPRTAEVSQSLCSERPKTRKMTDFWLIGHSAPTITGAKLPNCRQVMKLFYICDTILKTLRSPCQTKKLRTLLLIRWSCFGKWLG